MDFDGFLKGEPFKNLNQSYRNIYTWELLASSQGVIKLIYVSLFRHQYLRQNKHQFTFTNLLRFQFYFWQRHNNGVWMRSTVLIKAIWFTRKMSVRDLNPNISLKTQILLQSWKPKTFLSASFNALLQNNISSDDKSFTEDAYVRIGTQFE